MLLANTIGIILKNTSDYCVIVYVYFIEEDDNKLPIPDVQPDLSNVS